MHALWDASPIRRCTTKGRGCEYAQLGVAVCPCDGNISEESYQHIVKTLIDSLDGDASPLLSALGGRLRTLVDHERFEEAARCRDGWRSLASSLRRQRQWLALQRAGRIVAGDDEATLCIANGRLVAAWRTGTPMPFENQGAQPTADAPATMLEADEAGLLWSWLSRPGTQLIEVSGQLALPAVPVPDLPALD